MSEFNEVNYGELDCKLSDYMATDGVVLKSALNLSDIVDDILKLVNECSYPNYRSEQLQSQLAMAEMVIEEYNENVDYYESELAGSWLTIRETAREYFKNKEGK